MNAVVTVAVWLAAIPVSGTGYHDPAMGGAVRGGGGAAAAATTAEIGGPAPAVRVSGLAAPAVSFDGLGQGDGARPRPSDVNAAAGVTGVLQVVNRRLAVYTTGGSARCATTLGGLFGTADELFSPRVQYDPRYRRYSLVATVEPAASGPAALYLATTRGADPCGAWWTYRLGFSGPLFPPGTRLDRPNLGQDARSLLLSSDNVRAGGDVGSTVFALAKSAVYAGAPVAYQAFGVDPGTAPVNSDQAVDTGDSFYLTAVPGRGYRLYRMTGSAGPDPVLVLDAVVAAPFAAPGRRVRQCGPGTLDPLDGRIAAPAVRAGNFVWFTHGIDAGGRPGVRYGAISLLSYTPYLAVAARSTTSDDFNPSIAVADTGDGSAYAWLNWAFTDVEAQPCVDASAIAGWVEPGTGLPDLVGRGTVFARGAGSGVDAPFGAYSSATLDPASGCPAGAAVLAQQYFGADGRWRTRLARFGSC